MNMEEIMVELLNAAPRNRKPLILQFLVEFWKSAYKGNFYWAMSDSAKAKKVFGHQEIGWFNNKTELFLEEHPDDAQAILLAKLRWASENYEKISFDVRMCEHRCQLLSVEMKLKTEFYTPEDNFYLKIGLIPNWNEDYTKVVGYYDKPVVDFHF